MLSLLDCYCDGAREREAAARQVVIGVTSRGTGSTVDLTATMLNRPLWKHLRFQASTIMRNTEPAGEKISSQLATAASLADAASIVLSTLLRKLTADLGVDQKGFDESRIMHETGVDSLMAVQIRSWLKNGMGANVSVFDLIGNKSLRELGTTIVAKSRFSSNLA